MEAPQGLLNAVEIFAYDRHSRLTRHSIQTVWDEDDVQRLAIDKEGYLQFNVEVNEEIEQEGEFFYVEATIIFNVSEGEPLDTDPDTYECYLGTDGKWIIEWHSC